MCFFPFVGTVIGILTWLAGGILGMHAALEPFFLAVILTVIPVFITGGIHVDGLLDTSDAFKLLAGTHKEAGDPEGFPCRCICHYHSLRIFYPLAGSMGSAPWKL